MSLKGLLLTLLVTQVAFSAAAVEGRACKGSQNGECSQSDEVSTSQVMFQSRAREMFLDEDTEVTEQYYYGDDEQALIEKKQNPDDCQDYYYDCDEEADDEQALIEKKQNPDYCSDYYYDCDEEALIEKKQKDAALVEKERKKESLVETSNRRSKGKKGKKGKSGQSSKRRESTSANADVGLPPETPKDKNLQLLRVTGCENATWNGDYNLKPSDTDRWQKDETHEIYSWRGNWRLGDFGASTYTIQTTEDDGQDSPTMVDFEYGCKVNYRFKAPLLSCEKWATEGFRFPDHNVDTIVQVDGPEIEDDAFALSMIATYPAGTPGYHQGNLAAYDRQQKTGSNVFHMNIKGDGNVCVQGPGLAQDELCTTERLQKGDATQIAVTRNTQGNWTLCVDGSEVDSAANPMVKHTYSDPDRVFSIGSQQAVSKTARDYFKGKVQGAIFVRGCSYSCGEIQNWYAL